MTQKIFETNNTKRIIREIDEYIDDKDHNYAIALVGEWGSGKTRFIEDKLKNHLKDRKQKILIRVSLFGISSSKELYERIADALLHIDNSEKSKSKAIAKSSLSAIRKLVSRATSTAGIPINFNVSPEIVTSLLLNNKYILSSMT